MGVENRKQEKLNMWTFSAVWSGRKHKANTAFPSENVYIISMVMLSKKLFLDLLPRK